MYVVHFLQNKSTYPSMTVYEAWAMGYSGGGVIVGVIDTGVDEDHIDLVDNYVRMVHLLNTITYVWHTC